MKRKTKPRNQIVVAAPTAPVSHTDRVMQSILDASKDKATDVAKMREMKAFYSELLLDNDRLRLEEALARVSAQARVVLTDRKNDQTRSRYATLKAVDTALRPLYTAEGLRVSYDTADSPRPDHVRVVCRVTLGRAHEERHVDMPADGKGAKGGDVMTKTHATGSALTYGRRYALLMAFNVIVADASDDDGNAAGRGDCITAAQAKKIRDLLKEGGRDEMKFCQWMQIGSIEELPAGRYEYVIGEIAIATKAATKQEAAHASP